MKAIALESILTCPRCGFAALDAMPLRPCLYLYECNHCKMRLSTELDDACQCSADGSLKRQVDVDIQQHGPLARGFDSGYTSYEIESILDDLIDEETQAKFGKSAGLIVSVALGLGGEVELSHPPTP